MTLPCKPVLRLVCRRPFCLHARVVGQFGSASIKLRDHEDNATENRFSRPHLHHCVHGFQLGRYLVGAWTDTSLGTGV